MYLRVFLLSLIFLATREGVPAEPLLLQPDFLHLRNAEPREWSHFPERAGGTALSLSFSLENPGDYSLLTLRQEETKQPWKVWLNGTAIGTLLRDHNHLERGILIPEDLLLEGGNRLEIKTDSETPDDIRVGDVQLHRKPLPLGSPEELAELEKQRGFTRPVPAMDAEITLRARDADTRRPLPCRFTILDQDTGALVFVGAESNDDIAVREGVVYALNGEATVRLAGSSSRPRNYRVFCGRGFEYSLAEESLRIDGSGKAATLEFSIRREVNTDGLVSCDPHLHTYEFDRHGDCTLTERLISIAGEGVELPVSTGHDKHIPYREEADRIGASPWFTTVLGCEVTTHLGHFNSFPIVPDSSPAEHKLRPWANIFDNIFATPGVKICILNHGRDVHRGFTPLAPENFDPASGTFTQGRELRANAMELVNSGAQQTDPMQLVRDWFALLKSGHSIAGIGSSDSHTVNFAIAGQARTYLRCPDDDPAAINVSSATKALLEGKAMTSFGLLTTLGIKGDLVALDVRGPGWTTATEVQLFRNGEKVRSFPIPDPKGSAPGEKFSGVHSLKELGAEPGDFFCAVATGPGITEGWWPIMPPYQPDSPDFAPFVIGISEAVWVR